MDMSFVTLNVVTLLYLVASICMIQALKGLSSPATARGGNAFGMTGMAIAAVTTLLWVLKLKASATSGSGGLGFGLILTGLVIGGGIGTILAKRVEMTICQNWWRRCIP